MTPFQAPRRLSSHRDEVTLPSGSESGLHKRATFSRPTVGPAWKIVFLDYLANSFLSRLHFWHFVIVLHLHNLTDFCSSNSSKFLPVANGKQRTRPKRQETKVSADSNSRNWFGLMAMSPLTTVCVMASCWPRPKRMREK
jgi:hypothetical protein